MRITRLYLELANLGETRNFALPNELSHRLKRVLRLKPGSLLTVFNGCGTEFSAKLTGYEKNSAIIELLHIQNNQSESPLKTELLLGISRGERMDYAIQKSIELGVNCIKPIFTKYTEVKLSGSRLEKRLLHWRGVCISASEQSGRASIPEINTPKLLSSTLSEDKEDKTKLLFQPQATMSLKDISIAPCSKISLLIGSEGGLSNDEITLAKQHGYSAIQLGPRILRTETAPLAALAALQVLFGDLQ